MSLSFTTLLVAICATAGGAEAPRWLGYVHPAGGQRGSTVEVTIGGQGLLAAQRAVMSGSGIQVELLPAPELDAEELQKLKQASRKSPLAETRKLRLHIAADAPLGLHSLCLVTSAGPTNIRNFEVGELPETVEANEDVANKPRLIAVEALPGTISGRILPGDLDTIVFRGKCGQPLVATIAARALIPFIADAVPGWLQAFVTLMGPDGRILASADSWRFSQDPVLHAVLPSDGEYRLTIRDSIWRGREDFVYRIRLGELPFITAVAPLGGNPGNALPVIGGWNLDGAEQTLTWDHPEQEQYLIRNGIRSNPITLEAGRTPAFSEQSLPETAEGRLIAGFPAMIDGCISLAGERDRYRFTAAAGVAVQLDLSARRLGSPLDAVLTLRDGMGAVLVRNDDASHERLGMTTHVSDSRIDTVIPKQGSYVVEVTDLLGTGGDAWSYRLYVGSPRTLVSAQITPAATLIAPGAQMPFVLHIQGNANHDLDLAFAEPMPHLSLSPSSIPAGIERTLITIGCAADAPSGPCSPRLVLRHQDGSLMCQIPFAEEQTQAFLWRHLVGVEPIVLIDDSPAHLALSVAIPDQGFLGVVPGGEGTVVVHIERKQMGDRPLRLQLVDPPLGWSLAKAGIGQGRERATVVIRAAADAKPAANLVLQAQMFIDGGIGEIGKKQGVKRFVAYAQAVPVRLVTRAATASSGSNPADIAENPDHVAIDPAPAAAPSTPKPITDGAPP